MQRENIGLAEKEEVSVRVADEPNEPDSTLTNSPDPSESLAAVFRAAASQGSNKDSDSHPDSSEQQSNSVKHSEPVQQSNEGQPNVSAQHSNSVQHSVPPDTSELRNEVLVALAMHPDTPEQEWLAACTELNNRNISLPCKPPRRANKKQQQRILLLTITGFTILGAIAGAVCQSNFAEPKKSTGPRMEAPYNILASDWQTHNLNRKLTIKLANSISERGWTDKQAADYLHVSPEAIHDLLRNKSNLHMEDKIKMLIALDKPVDIQIDQMKEWTRSSEGAKATRKDQEDAVNFYTRVLNLEPNRASTYMSRASAYEELGQNELAIKDYTRSIELDPNLEGALNNRSLLYQSLGRSKEALADVNELVRRDPDDWGNYSNRGLIYFHQGNLDAALSDFNKAVRLGPQRPGPLTNRALVYEQQGNYTEAIRDLEKSLEKDPTNNHARERIEKIRAKQKN